MVIDFTIKPHNQIVAEAAPPTSRACYHRLFPRGAYYRRVRWLLPQPLLPDEAIKPRWQARGFFLVHSLWPAVLHLSNSVTSVPHNNHPMRLLKPDDRLDFFVVALDNGKHVGRIFRSSSTRRELPWCWTISFSLRHGEGPHQGFEPTRKDAMRAFRDAWNAQQQ
jgi:hypothetical protein